MGRAYLEILHELRMKPTPATYQRYLEAKEQRCLSEADRVWVLDFAHLFDSLPEQQQQLIRWSALGLNQQQIADKLGIGRRSVTRRFSEFNMRSLSNVGAGKKIGRPKKVTPDGL